ncbi:hypothetical protein [Bacillus cereus]|uniref:hypothetical protein n=1 Tax=Bacillus cereus TaxID=1396 RepID=UPI0036347944
MKEKILINFIDNVVKYAEDGGTVYVETPIASWKIYTSPYRPKLVVDHKPNNGKWHNQGGHTVYPLCSVWSAINYISDHDYDYKGADFARPLIISDRSFGGYFPSTIYCLTSTNPLASRYPFIRREISSVFSTSSDLFETKFPYVFCTKKHLKEFDSDLLKKYLSNIECNELDLKSVMVEIMEFSLQERRYKSKEIFDIDEVLIKAYRQDMKVKNRNIPPNRISKGSMCKYRIVFTNGIQLETSARNDLQKNLFLKFGLSPEESNLLLSQKAYIDRLSKKIYDDFENILQEKGVGMVSRGFSYNTNSTCFEIFLTQIRNKYNKEADIHYECNQYLKSEFNINNINKEMLPFSLGVVEEKEQKEIKQKLNTFGITTKKEKIEIIAIHI